ncbi:MAG: relaxase/mobilization nuclease domain-containing protein [Proteobacteria bacterium]|nr:relaxase/mobilization nuclease domain-containing protein [Pseudomonadota bacterium]MBS0552509.1 relaxase/mobilization nuclease domain-containing protein [Pseudomonadota bacterium]
MNDLKDEWTHGLYGIPMESRRREAFNIVLSMPPGTNRDAVTQAARRFAQSEFSANHHYVFAAHDDEKHPHVHLCVQAQGIDGTRLNPRKADLQRWREHFAEKLREQGVRANATPRTARGVSKRSKRQPAIHRVSRVSREALPLTSKQAPQRTQDNFSASQRAALTAYRQIAAGLARSPNNEDRRLALGIVEFVRQMPALRDRNPPAASRDTPVAEPALKRSTGQDRDR